MYLRASNFKKHFGLSGVKPSMYWQVVIKRYLIRIAVCAGAFLIGGAAAHVSFRVYPRFTQVSTVSLVSPPDGRGGGMAYKSYDGEYLFYEHLDFPSRESATAAFRVSVHKAERIIEREILYDRARKSIVGERVVAMFRANGREGGEVIVVDDTKLYLFYSTSLRHAKFFERSQLRY